MSSPPLEESLMLNVQQGLSLATEVFSGIKGCSPSLDILSQIWEEAAQQTRTDANADGT